MGARLVVIIDGQEHLNRSFEDDKARAKYKAKNEAKAFLKKWKNLLANKQYEIFIDVDQDDVKGYQRDPVMLEISDQRLFYTSIGEAMRALGWTFKRVVKNNIIDEAIDSAAEEAKARRLEADQEQGDRVRELVAEEQF